MTSIPCSGRSSMCIYIRKSGAGRGSKGNEEYDIPQDIKFDLSYRGVSKLLTYGVLLSQDDWQIPIRLPKAKDKDDSTEMH